MQRYRVNYVLLVSLIIGGLACSGAVYGLWRFQIDRNAGSVLERAKTAYEKGNLREAAGLYQRYLAIRTEDEEALAARARIWKEIVASETPRPEDFAIAYKIMEDTVREFPQNVELRKDMVEMCMSNRFRQFDDALDHVRILRDQNPEDIELQVLESRCLVLSKDRTAADYSYKLIGYDPKTEKFDVENAKAPDQAIVYLNLANLLRQSEGRPELADRIMDQLVDANPESYEAYLNRGQYLGSNDRKQRAEDDIRKAYELNADDPDVLLALAGLERDLAVEAEESGAGNFEKAEEILQIGQEKYPQDSRFYQLLADVSMRQLKYDDAMEHLNRGIETVSPTDSLLLVLVKGDLQIRAMDLEGVKETINAMQERNIRPEFVDWMRARILLAESQWHEASKELEIVKDKMTNFPDTRRDIEVNLALCYEKLGQYDKAIDAYKVVLRGNPENTPAQFGLQRVENRVGRPNQQQGQEAWQARIQEELKKPEGQRDWDNVAQMMNELADKMQLNDARRTLLEAELKMMQEDYKQSRLLLQKAFSEAPDDLTVQLAAVRLLRRDPEQGPVAALKFLEERVVKKFANSPALSTGGRAALRNEKANLLIAINDGELSRQLAELTEGIDDWSDQDKIQLWYSMATKYLSIGMREEAQDAWKKVAELSPNDLPTRMTLFALAYEANDDAEMSAAQERILDVVKIKSHPNYLYTEARRKLSLFRRGELGEEALDEANEMINKAFAERPEWHELHLVSAELAMLERDYDSALVHYEKASQLGRVYPAAIVQHVRLLVSRGRFAEAKIVVDRLPETTRQRLLGQLYSEILFNNKLIPEAIASAEKVIELDPENGAKQLWYGQFMARTVRTPQLSDSQRAEIDKKSGEALQRAVELSPTNQQAWLALVGYHVLHKDRASAEQALREAQLALSSEQLPLVLARCYETMGRWFDAENLYKMIYDARPENLAAIRQLAAFYLGASNPYNRNQKIAKATPLLNAILRAAADDKSNDTDPSVIWARRISADLLAGTGDYQSALKAENLLASNSRDGLLPIKDRMHMAQILSNRPEPISRMKAANLLEEVKAIDRLNLPAELKLGQLYYSLGDWQKCRRQMQEVIGRFPDVPEARSTFITMLLQKGEAREAERQLKRLMKIAPMNQKTLELMARVAAETGNEQQAAQALRRALPSDLSKIKDEELPRLEAVANLLSEVLNDKQNSLQLYKYLVSRNGARVLKLAEVLGRHHDVAESYELLEKVYKPRAAPTILNTALLVQRARRDEIGDKFDEQTQTWLDRGFREDPESIPLRMQQAEFYDIQQRYTEAAATYRELLARGELKGINRAIVLNNLSYLLALKGDSSDGRDALKFVKEAVDIMGPTADILDTRAVVFMAQKEYDEAIKDLELSVTENPTASKYFHKALAHLNAGQNSDAVEAWEEAERLGLTRDDVNRMERDKFDEAKSRIEQLQTASAGYRSQTLLSKAE